MANHNGIMGLRVRIAWRRGGWMEREKERGEEGERKGFFF